VIEILGIRLDVAIKTFRKMGKSLNHRNRQNKKGFIFDGTL